MTIGKIRRFTDEDRAALNESAARFAERHGFQLGTDGEPWTELDVYLSYGSDNRSDTGSLRRLWQACRCRALGLPVSADITVAYGYVGYRVR